MLKMVCLTSLWWYIALMQVKLLRVLVTEYTFAFVWSCLSGFCPFLQPSLHLWIFRLPRQHCEHLHQLCCSEFSMPCMAGKRTEIVQAVLVFYLLHEPWECNPRKADSKCFRASSNCWYILTKNWRNDQVFSNRLGFPHTPLRLEIGLRG